MDIKIIIQNLVAENHKDNIYHNNSSINWMNILFSTVLTNHSETIQFNNYDIGNDFSLIFQHIQQNYKNLTLNSLAEHFHYSEPHLSKLIKKCVGMNFTNLIANLRMADAEYYLVNTDLSIEKISEYVGYHSVEHFSRTFKRYYEKSPQQYKKLL